MIYNMLPQVGGDLPKGVIVMWSGAVDAVPDSWALCDGTNGTPDLRGRFALGAGSSYAVGITGGEEKHKLTVDEMPVHRHGGNSSVAGNHNHMIYSNTRSDPGDISEHPTIYEWLVDRVGKEYTAIGYSGNHSHTLTISDTGGNQPHNNMPPYYTLAYIMKL